MSATRRALIVVDVQNDFVEGGSLAVEGGRAVAGKITDHLRDQVGTYALVIASKDFHTAGSSNGGHFAAEGADPDYATTWPAHCVAGTAGSDYAPGLDGTLIDIHVKKGMGVPAYSAFQGVDEDGQSLHAILQAAEITDVDICGIATDYCVKATALDAREHGLGVRLLSGLHAGVADATSRVALDEMTARGVEVDDQHPDNYQASKYSPIFVTVDLAIFTIRNGALSVLLVERGDEPFRGCWALPGGFVEPDEDTDAAAWRELHEETGVEQFDGHLEQLRTYSAPDRDPRHRIVSVAHVAFAPNLPEPTAGSDASAARWWAVEEVMVDPDLAGHDEGVPALAFDHAVILADAVERVRSKVEYTTLALRFVAEPFSLPEVYRIYAAVWGEEPDKRNFIRKFQKTAGAVALVHDKSEGNPTGGPKPKLYRRGPATALQPPMLRPSADPATRAD